MKIAFVVSCFYVLADREIQFILANFVIKDILDKNINEVSMTEILYKHKQQSCSEP